MAHAKTALIVDDSSSMRMCINYALKEAGYLVSEAPDGQQALSMAKTTSFNLIITDINMPVMGGYELTDKLRLLPQYKHTPILILTTESSPEAKAIGKKSGATGWIIKPFNQEKLSQVFDRLCA